MNKLVAYGIVITAVLFTCSSRRPFDHGYFGIGISKGVLNHAEIDEASGLVASVRNAGMFWTHNDSGDEPRIFLIDTLGRCHAEVHLSGAKNRDWEDITLGPGPEKDVPYLYIGDIGDNFARYDYKYLYRIPEPVITRLDEGNVPRQLTIRSVDSIKVALEDQPRDTEAMMTDPWTGDIYVFSKREGTEVNVYKLAFPMHTEGQINTASLVCTIPYVQLTAADMSADGTELLVKNYKTVLYWTRSSGESMEMMLKKQPAHLPYAAEPQGEAIAFDRTGDGYYTLSESVRGRKVHMMFYQREK